MPKGFLVKRSKKTGPVSYRVRGDEDSATPQTYPPAAGVSSLSFSTPPLALPTTCFNSFPQRTPSRLSFGGMPESFCGPSLSPTRPDSEEYANQYPSADAVDQMRYSTSPAQAELFPEPILGSFAINGSPVSPSLPEMTTKLDSMCSERAPAAGKRPAPSSDKPHQPRSKKRKSSNSSPQDKKSISRDEVTTSPVLGLRIKEDPEEDAKQRSNTSSPLGEFICQLCKERYSDPLTLAHHKCSRIVRVEYRCTECDKAFSCPANLASHRRWHKPRSGQTDSVSPQREESRPMPTPATVGQGGVIMRDTSTPSPQPSDSGSDEEMSFSCPQCSKKFRRQAYLRKHLALHNRKAASLLQSQLPIDATASKPHQSSRIESGPVYSDRESSQESLAKYPATEHTTKVSGDVFPCRFCGDNFFSSPGLTRHINKHHPTETRQVIFLSQAV